MFGDRLFLFCDNSSRRLGFSDKVRHRPRTKCRHTVTEGVGKSRGGGTKNIRSLNDGGVGWGTGVIF